MSSISVIIPTIGRESIRRTLDSIVSQMHPGDDVVVVGDGPCQFGKDFFRKFSRRILYKELPFRTWDWGGVPRNVGIQNAKGDYLAFMDDDDVYLPRAFDALHKAIDKNKGRSFLFKMHHHDRVIWNEPVIMVGNVSTQMILTPNVKGRMPFWESHYEADLKFIEDLSASLPVHEPIMWMPSIIAKLEDHSQGGH